MRVFLQKKWSLPGLLMAINAGNNSIYASHTFQEKLGEEGKALSITRSATPLKIARPDWKAAHERVAEALEVVQSHSPDDDLFNNFPGGFSFKYKSVMNLFYENYSEIQNLNKYKKRYTADQLLNQLHIFLYHYEEAVLRLAHDKQYPDNLSFLNTDILPFVQTAVNQYFQAYEKLTNISLPEYGELRHKCEILYNCQNPDSEAQLYYKKAEGDYLVFFPAYPLLPNIQPDYFFTKVGYIYPCTDNGGIIHSLMLQLDRNNKASIDLNSGIVIRRQGSILSIFFYNGPGKGSLSLTSTIEAFFGYDSSETLEIACTSLPSPGTPTRDKEGISSSDSPDLKLQQGYTIEVDEVFYNRLQRFIRENLEDKDSTFIPFPGNNLEELEYEYLLLRDLPDQSFDSGHNTPLQNYALEFFTALYPNATLKEIREDYEARIFEAYVDKEQAEYLEQVRQEQEQISLRVAQEAHYKAKPEKASGNKHKKTQSSKQPARNIAEKISTVNPDKAAILAAKRSEIRLNILKDHLTRNKPEKYRKFLGAVNIAARELSKNNIPVTGFLNKSSHGYLESQGNKHLLVRPHGKYDTIRSKNAKGILTGLLKGYLNQNKLNIQ